MKQSSPIALTFLYLIAAYSQESGRAGRDGKPAEAVILFNMDDLGKSTTRPEMKEYCLLTTCRRQFLAQRFGTGADVAHFDDTELHNCCDNCAKLCCCGHCNTDQTQDVLDTSDSENSGQDAVKSLISNTLLALFHAINTQMDTCFDPRLVTGLTTSLAADIYELLSPVGL